MHNQPRAMPATVAALPTIIQFSCDRGCTVVDGTTTPGVVRGTTWYLRNANNAGPGEWGLIFAP